MPCLTRADKTLLAESILWLEGDGNYTRVHRIGQPVLLVAYTLKRFEGWFSDFVRVRRGGLVNPRYIQCIRWHGNPKLTVHLSDGTVLMASRRRHRMLTEQLRQQERA